MTDFFADSVAFHFLIILIPLKCEKILPRFIFLPKNVIQQTLIMEGKARPGNAFGRIGQHLMFYASSACRAPSTLKGGRGTISLLPHLIHLSACQTCQLQVSYDETALGISINRL